MTHYEELLASLQVLDQQKAEYFEEEVDIMKHKLKFLPSESFPAVLILKQENHFAATTSTTLIEKTKLAGGVLLADIDDNPNTIIIIQNGSDLYSLLPDFLEQDWVKSSAAYQHNAIYIIEDSTFDEDINQYLQESEILAEILQPKYFFFGHEGALWTKFNLTTS